MKIKLSSKIISFVPGIRYTVILLRQVNNTRKISNLSQLLRGTAVVAKNDLKKPERKDLFERVTNITTEDGATFLGAYLLDARLKKIMAGKDIDGSNNLQNLVNWLSLKYYLPLFGFDLDQLGEDYYLDLYEPKKGKKAPDLDFLPQTQNCVIFFPNLGGWQDEELDTFIGEMNLNLHKYLQTEIAGVFELNSEHTEVDLEYQSVLELEHLQAEALEKQALGTTESIPEAQSEGQPNQLAPTITLSPEASTIIHAWLSDLVRSEFPELKIDEPSPEFTPADENNTAPSEAINLAEYIEVDIPREAGHGDLTTNLAMKLAKKLGQSPQQIAIKIQSALEVRNSTSPKPMIEKVETVGPGFINIYLTTAYFQEKLGELLQLKDQYGQSNIGQGHKIMVEFGSLNMAKPFGAHHFLTTIIGQTLVNLYRMCGYSVLAGDYPGDWGTQFGKSIYAYRHWGDKDTVEKDPMNELLKLYVKFHEEAEKDPSLEDAARQEFQKLETGNEENLQLWKWLVEVTKKDLDAIYQTLGVHHDRVYPESKYNASCQKILEQGKSLGVITPGEKGAYIVDLEDANLPPALVQKGDGTTLYITRDLASIEDRLKSEMDLERLVYVVDLAQTLHFKQLFTVASKMHQADPGFPTADFKHVPFGRMSFADSSMSTRKGNIIQGKDIIEEAHKRAEQIVEQKIQGNGQQFSAAEKHKLIHGLAVGAIKYAMLCQTPESDFVFDWDRVISLDGNSAPYLQYTLARGYSILRKLAEQSGKNLAENVQESISPTASAEGSAGRNTKRSMPESEGQITLFTLDEEKRESDKVAEQAAAESAQTVLGEPSEQVLIRLLAEFPQKVAAAAENYKPNTVTSYLYQLAQEFNRFYGTVPVLRTNREDLRASRVDLVRATVQVLKNGLRTMGIATFERM